MPAAAAPASRCTAQPERRTFEFADKSGQKLLLDRIVDKCVALTGKRPVAIFSFGGSWETGTRNDPNAEPFFDFVASQGFTVVAIDYRLGMKEAKAKGEMTPANAIDLYLRAIQWGVEDLFDATNFVLKNADAWDVDKGQIVIMGSSSGAINSLMAEYNVANESDLARAHLPAGFRYAGVISMAGAFLLKGADTPLVFKSRPAPILFFHGTKDQLVVYDETHVGYSGYGPAYYARRFAGSDYPKWFIDVADGDHVIAGAPLFEYREEVAAFLQRFVREKQQLSIRTIETDAVPKTLTNFMRLYGSKLRKPPVVPVKPTAPGK